MIITQKPTFFNGYINAADIVSLLKEDLVNRIVIVEFYEAKAKA